MRVECNTKEGHDTKGFCAGGGFVGPRSILRRSDSPAEREFMVSGLSYGAFLMCVCNCHVRM